MAFGQSVRLTESEIEKYAKAIDLLLIEHKLVRVSLPDMSGCGGALDGYYLNESLVLIQAEFQGELGFFSQKIYMRHDQILKLIYREHFAAWETYYEKYPAEKYTLDATKMTYTDTVYSVILTSPPLFRKSSAQKTISNKLNQKLADRLVSCGQSMKLELQEVIAHVDSIQFIKEMPYACEHGICGDHLYWEVVKLGDDGIELLIDKLDDATPTTASVPIFGGHYAIADIAFTALNEIIHDIPTFELLGVPFDQSGCGYCAYWNHLNKSVVNRQNFKKAVKSWYHRNKSHLVWIESQHFVTCDCHGDHPNGGHYEMISTKK